MSTYTKLEQTCMIETDLLQPLFHFILTRLPAVLRQAWKLGKLMEQCRSWHNISTLIEFPWIRINNIKEFCILSFICPCRPISLLIKCIVTLYIRIRFIISPSNNRIFGLLVGKSFFVAKNMQPLQMPENIQAILTMYYK